MSRSRVRCRSLFVLSVVAIIVIALAGTIAATPAHADGDPASDVLATQSLFLPWDANVPAVGQEQLSALLAQAKRGGYPIRVALIASPADLGSVGALWHKPQSYAEFLAQELSLLYRGPLLVVMPDGFGIENANLAVGGIRHALGGIPVARDGAQLAEDTLTAVRRLAGAAGHPLTATATVAAPPRSTDSSDDGWLAWLAYAVGAVLIVLAWAASLRAQPMTHTR